MSIDSRKKNAEPFNVVGERATIWNVEEARKIAKDNTYYFFAFAAIILGLVLSQKVLDFPSALPTEIVVAYCILIIALGIVVRVKLSRIAAILLALNFGFVLLERLLDFANGNGFGFMGLVISIMLMAAIRSVQATFSFHRYNANEKNR